MEITCFNAPQNSTVDISVDNSIRNTSQWNNVAICLATNKSLDATVDSTNLSYAISDAIFAPIITTVLVSSKSFEIWSANRCGPLDVKSKPFINDTPIAVDFTLPNIQWCWWYDDYSNDDNCEGDVVGDNFDTITRRIIINSLNPLSIAYHQHMLL